MRWFARRSKSSGTSGFTLVEALVVIVVLIILFLIGQAAFRKISVSAQDIRKRADIDSIVKAYETNYDPVTGLYKPITGSNFASGKIPQNPAGLDYDYYFNTDNSGFRVCAPLGENTNMCSENSGTCVCNDSVKGKFNTQASNWTPAGGITGSCFIESSHPYPVAWNPPSWLMTPYIYNNSDPGSNVIGTRIHFNRIEVGGSGGDFIRFEDGDMDPTEAQQYMHSWFYPTQVKNLDPVKLPGGWLDIEGRTVKVLLYAAGYDRDNWGFCVDKIESITPTPTPLGVQTNLGYETIGASDESGSRDFIQGSKFTTGSKGGATSSISVYAGKVYPDQKNYSMAIYSDNNGKPYNKIAETAVGTLIGDNSWNSLPITATLAPNTNYWFLYNTSVIQTSPPTIPYIQTYNNPKYDGNYTNGSYALGQTFGTWPVTLDQGQTPGSKKYSIYVTYLAQ
jgi:Tfp pilus assembly protein PilE